MLASKTTSTGLQIAPDLLLDLEREISTPEFMGIGLGPTLNDMLMIELFNANRHWGLRQSLADRLRRVKYTARPVRYAGATPQLPPGRLLVTLLSTDFRGIGMVFPVLDALGPDKCLVLCRTHEMVDQVPPGATPAWFGQLMSYDVAQWRRNWRKYWPQVRSRLAAACRRHGLPKGVVWRAGAILSARSQNVAGCLEFLSRQRPKALLVEFDRNSQWACLVLAARKLGIPTFTMLHGVLNEQAIGYVPIQADKLFCWGQMDREKFVKAGEDPARIIPVGNQRITRELAVSATEAREKLNLPSKGHVAMLGTAPYNPTQCLELAEAFCQAVGQIDGLTGLVRLHPSESLKAYESVAARYPNIRFVSNAVCSLDESLAAADFVVVRDSGLGSDALVKRRLTVVLDVRDAPAGHGLDLVEQAGCPFAASAEQLAAILRDLVASPSRRDECQASRERYVERFCFAFGRQAAENIASEVTSAVAEQNSARTR